MKILRSVPLLALTTVIFLALASCGGSKSDMLVGEWKISDVSIDQEIPEGMEELFEEMMNSIKDNSNFQFNADGTYSISIDMGMGGAQESTGMWELNEDGTVLKTQEEGDEEWEEINVTELSADKVVIGMDEGGQSIEFTLEPAG